MPPQLRELTRTATQPRRQASIAVRPDSQRIAVGTTDGQVRVWNTGNGELLQTLRIELPINTLCWSADGTRLAVGTALSADGNPPQARLVIFGPPLPPQTPQPGNELMLHQDTNCASPFRRLEFDREGRNLWSIQENGELDSWAYASPTFVRRFDHGGPVYGVAVSRDGTTIVSGSADQTLRIWDVKTGQQRAQLSGHQGSVHSVAFTPDESMVISTSADRTVRAAPGASCGVHSRPRHTQ